MSTRMAARCAGERLGSAIALRGPRAPFRPRFRHRLCNDRPLTVEPYRRRKMLTNVQMRYGHLTRVLERRSGVIRGVLMFFYCIGIMLLLDLLYSNLVYTKESRASARIANPVIITTWPPASPDTTGGVVAMPIGCIRTASASRTPPSNRAA